MKTRQKTKKRKAVLAIASKLHGKLQNMYTTQYENFSKVQKKKTNVSNRPESLALHLYLDKDDLPLMPLLEDDEGVITEPEETIAKRVELNSRKRKDTETGLKILTPNKLLPRIQYY